MLRTNSLLIMKRTQTREVPVAVVTGNLPLRIARYDTSDVRLGFDDDLVDGQY